MHTKLLRICITVWKVGRGGGDYAKNIHSFVKVEDPKSKPGSVDTGIGRVLQVRTACCLDINGVCALFGLHLMAARVESGSGGSQSPDLGDMWRHGCSKSPDWDSDVESWSESEGTLSSDFCGHNVESFALHVIGLNLSGEKVFSWRTGKLRGWSLYCFGRARCFFKP